MQKQLSSLRQLGAAPGSGPIMMAPSSQHRLSAHAAGNSSGLLGLAPPHHNGNPVDALKQSSGAGVRALRGVFCGGRQAGDGAGRRC